MKLYRGLYRDFVERHMTAYYLLCVTLGIGWTEDRVEMTKRIIAAWRGPEHGKLPESTSYTNDQLLEALQVILDHTDLYQPVYVALNDIAPERRIRRIATGAKFEALVRRWRDDFPDGIPADTNEMMCSFGSRKRRDDLDGTLSEIWELIDKAGIQDIPWVKEQRELGEAGLAHEHQLGILSILIAFGDRVRLGGTDYNGAVQYMYLGDTKVTVVDAPAVSTQVGYERPTSASAMDVVVALFPPEPDEVLILHSGGPHTVRVPLDAAVTMWDTKVDGGYPYAGIEAHAAGSVNSVFISPPIDGAEDRRPYGAVLALGEMLRFARKAYPPDAQQK